MNSKNEVFEYLIDQLRQQVNSSNPYKQQCEDLAHDVLSLKNQLRDTSALVAELQEDNIRKSEHISHLTGQVKDLTKQLALAAGDVGPISPRSNPVAVRMIVRNVGTTSFTAKA